MSSNKRLLLAGAAAVAGLAAYYFLKGGDEKPSREKLKGLRTFFGTQKRKLTL
jgi:hypothetical protein